MNEIYIDYYANILVEDYINSLPDDIEFIQVSDRKITCLPSLSRFHNLKKFICSGNRLKTLPELNRTLEYLNCSYNNLKTLPEIKNTSLTILYCNNNKLTSLPELNPSLQELYCSNNYLTSLPELSFSLKILFCEFNLLRTLPKLNPSLKQLSCHSNYLINLPKLNPLLEELYCFNNDLTNLPEINHSLIKFICHNNSLPPFLDYNGYFKNGEKNFLNYRICLLHRVKHLYWSLKYKQKFRDILWKKIRLPKIEKQYHPDNLKELLLHVGENEEELNNALSVW